MFPNVFQDRALEQEVFDCFSRVVTQGTLWVVSWVYSVDVFVQLYMLGTQAENNDLVSSSKGIYRVLSIWSGHIREDCSTLVT